MSGTMMDPDNNDGNLGGASSTNSFSLVVSSENDPDSSVSSHHLFPVFSPYERVSLICQSVVFQATDETIGH